MTVDRVLKLDEVHNFRDYGGYPVTGGGRMRRRVLWRAGQQSGATDADLAKIAALGLVSVHDLRSAAERERNPARYPAAFTATIHVPPEKTAMMAPHVTAAAEAKTAPKQRTAQSMRESLKGNYSKIAFRPELIAAMRRYVLDLADGKGPVLINCMAGKDRTGVAVAMVQAAVGVHHDDIMADYLLTNTAGDAAARINAGIDTIKAFSRYGGQDIDEAVLRVLMGVEAEYLETLFDAVNERCGSLAAYLERELGVTDKIRSRLCAALIE